MRIKIHLKDPDGFDISLNENVDTTRPQGLSDREWGLVRDERIDKWRTIMSKWVDAGEYVTLEVDFDAPSMRVVPRGE